MSETISLLKEIFKNEGFSKEVICGILGNIQIESNFKCIVENMNYTTAARLRTVFPSHFSGQSDTYVNKYVKNPVALGDLVYKKLGGYKYRGRGFIQITGLSNYKTYGDGTDVVNNPDLAATPEIAAKMTVNYIKKVAFPLYKNLNDCKDAAVVADVITKAIQGPGKNYTKGFLLDHLLEKRKAALNFYKTYEQI